MKFDEIMILSFTFQLSCFHTIKTKNLKIKLGVNDLNRMILKISWCGKFDVRIFTHLTYFNQQLKSSSVAN